MHIHVLPIVFKLCMRRGREGGQMDGRTNGRKEIKILMSDLLDFQSSSRTLGVVFKRIMRFLSVSTLHHSAA